MGCDRSRSYTGRPARLRSMAAALEVRFDHMALLVYLCQGAWAA